MYWKCKKIYFVHFLIAYIYINSFKVLVIALYEEVTDKGVVTKGKLFIFLMKNL